MLVLTRKENSRVVVTHGGETLTVMVVEARRGSAKLAFEGPAGFKLLREELADQDAVAAAGESGRE